MENESRFGYEKLERNIDVWKFDYGMKIKKKKKKCDIWDLTMFFGKIIMYIFNFIIQVSKNFSSEGLCRIFIL